MSHTRWRQGEAAGVAPPAQSPAGAEVLLQGGGGEGGEGRAGGETASTADLASTLLTHPPPGGRVVSQEVTYSPALLHLLTTLSLLAVGVETPGPAQPNLHPVLEESEETAVARLCHRAGTDTDRGQQEQEKEKKEEEEGEEAQHL